MLAEAPLTTPRFRYVNYRELYRHCGVCALCFDGDGCCDFFAVRSLVFCVLQFVDPIGTRTRSRRHGQPPTASPRLPSLPVVGETAAEAPEAFDPYVSEPSASAQTFFVQLP